MSNRVLDFSQYIGGADNVKMLSMFPRSQKSYVYNFGKDVSGYTFTADYQTIVVDTITWDRNTGEPNFATSTVIGYIENTANVAANVFIDTSVASSGNVKLTIPANRYTGNITPSARTNIAMTVLSFEWETNDTPPQKDSHRYAILEVWEPGVTPGSPLDDANFVSLV